MVASQVAGARVGHDRQRYDSGRCTRTRSRVIRGYSAMVRGVSRKRQGDAQRPSMPWARHVLGAIGSSVHVLRPTQTCVCQHAGCGCGKRLCVIASFVTDRAAAARHRVAARSVCRRARAKRVTAPASIRQRIGRRPIEPIRNNPAASPNLPRCEAMRWFSSPGATRYGPVGALLCVAICDAARAAVSSFRVLHAFDRCRPRHVAGGRGQRLPHPHPAVFVAAAVGPDRAGRGGLRRLRCRARAGTGAVLPVVPAATAVSGWLAHSQTRPVPRQGGHSGTGVGAGHLHRDWCRLLHPLADTGDAAGRGVCAGSDHFANRPGGGVFDRLQGADPQAPDAHSGRRVAAQRRLRAWCVSSSRWQRC